MEFLGSFKKLPLGWYRLILVGWIVFPIITLFILTIFNEQPNKLDEFIAVLGIILISYYVIIRLILWVRDGFKK